MTNTESITNVCVSIFIHTSNRRRDCIEAVFAPQVLLDYSPMSGQTVATMSPGQITAVWKQILPGFEQTHHQTGTIIITEHNTDADLF